MRTSITNGTLLSALIVAMTGCGENAWNDNLDGFKNLVNNDGTVTATDVQTINYTLTDADYEAVAKLTANKALATTDEESKALAAVGTNHCFSEAAPASRYMPAWFASTSSPFFTLSDKSAIKLTYNESVGLPGETAALQSARQYDLTTDDYIAIWGSDDNFINGFAPSKQPSKSIPGILAGALAGPAAGEYAIANYSVTDQEPIFGTVEETPSYTHTLATAITSGAQYAIVADGNAAVTLDKNYGYWSVEQVDEDGLGIALSEAACNFVIEAAPGGGYYIKDANNKYVYQSGTYNSFNFSSTLPENGAEWSIEIRSDGTAKILNKAVNKYIQYDPAYTSYGSYADAKGVMPKLYIALQKKAKAPLAEVPLTDVNALYAYNGSKWAESSDAVILQPADYTAMGQRYMNLSNDLPAQLLPKYLNGRFPYASADDEKYVLYLYYNGSATAYRCDLYIYDGTTWNKYNGVAPQTAQFVRSNGKWNYDPSVTITLPAGRSQPLSTLYFQTCVDWVKKYYPEYVTSYGNNEYYCGTSAYQGNVDLRPAAAKIQYEKGYEGMSDDEIVELMKQRFAFQVMPAALSVLHSDAVTVDGIEVLYTINFAVYTGATDQYTIVYKVTDSATFEMVQCTWWEGGQPATKLDLSQYAK